MCQCFLKLTRSSLLRVLIQYLARYVSCVLDETTVKDPNILVRQLSGRTLTVFLTDFISRNRKSLRT